MSRAADVSTTTGVTTALAAYVPGARQMNADVAGRSDCWIERIVDLRKGRVQGRDGTAKVLFLSSSASEVAATPLLLVGEVQNRRRRRSRCSSLGQREGGRDSVAIRHRQRSNEGGGCCRQGVSRRCVRCVGTMGVDAARNSLLILRGDTHERRT